jgi:hypothetical protein
MRCTTPDEEILSCAHYYSLYVSPRVCLISKDINQRMHAIGHLQLKAMTATEFLETDWAKALRLDQKEAPPARSCTPRRRGRRSIRKAASHIFEIMSR